MRPYVISLFFVAIFAGLNTITSCSGPSPIPSPWPDAGATDAPIVAGDCTAACANLKILGCAEGIDPDCARVCEKARATDLTDLHLDCLTAAASKEAARSCGTFKCR